MAQYLGEKFLEKYEVIGNIIGIRKFQKNPSKTHSGSTNSYKIGEKIFLIKKVEKKNELEIHEPEKVGTFI